jgi:hypothetical protein
MCNNSQEDTSFSMGEDQKSGTGKPENARKRFETITGLTLALFAAVLAVVDLGAGKYGDDEIMGTNEKANLFQWYQSKSIKQSIIEQEAGLISALLQAGVVTPNRTDVLRDQLAAAEKSAERYDKEKKEILLGSTAVGPQGQVLLRDGKKGAIFGTKPWEQKLSILGNAGDKFDLATLWLQVALVFGAISLIIESEKLKRAFYVALVLGSLLGTSVGIQAYAIAMSAETVQGSALTTSNK